MTVVRWLIVAALLAVSMLTAKLTLYNWWAADSPPRLYPEQYEMRGNALGE
jgi:hypothetical protein